VNLPGELVRRLASGETVVLAVKVIPKSSRNEIAGYLPDGTWKVKITAAPEGGKANAALCAFLADELGLPRRDVTILSGETSPRKRLRLSAPARSRPEAGG
jgi:uncharacterized protein (TIGR00251 family)